MQSGKMRVLSNSFNEKVKKSGVLANLHTQCRFYIMFTMLELLIVISVIMILISILMPALKKTREVTKGVACINNLKQIGISFASYRNDFNGMYMPAYTSATDKWDTYLNDNYLFTPKLFHCPSTSFFSYVGNSAYISYGYNFYHIATSYYYGGSTTIPARENQLKSPSRTITHCDTLCLNFFPEDKAGNYLVNSFYATTVSGSGGGAVARHSSKVNILWADSHASSIKCANQLNPYSELGTSTTSNPTIKTYWNRL